MIVENIQPNLTFNIVFNCVCVIQTAVEKIILFATSERIIR